MYNNRCNGRWRQKGKLSGDGQGSCNKVETEQKETGNKEREKI